jgi:hypothetical protein
MLCKLLKLFLAVQMIFLLFMLKILPRLLKKLLLL